jgi:hypothetical protein
MAVLNMGMLSVHDVFVDPMRSKIALFNRFRGERGAALSIVMVWGGGVGGRSAGAKPVS